MNYDDKQYMYHWINRKNSVRVPLDDNPRAFFEVYIEMGNIERAEFLRKLGAFVEEYINSRPTSE